MSARARTGGILAGAGVVLAALVAIPFFVLLSRAVDAGGWAAIQALLSRDGAAVVQRSIGLSVGVAIGCVALSVPLAWLVTATDLPGRRVWRLLLALPLAVPSYVGGFVVVAAFGPAGWLSGVLPRVPDVYGVWGTVLALAFVYPYAMLPLIASLERTDPAQFEAARSLGDRPFRAWFRVIFPQLRHALATGGLLIALYVLSDFGAVSLTRFRSLSYLVYIRYQNLFGRDEAILYGLMLMGIAALLVGLRAWLLRGKHAVGGSSGVVRPWPRVPLGKWRWPALALCSAVVAYGVVLPLAVVTYWLVRGVGLGAPIHDFREALTGTLGIGAAGALLVVAIAVIPAALSRLRPGLMASTVQGFAHAGYALPGIVVALAIVATVTQHIPVLYQTIPLLCIAYVIRFLPVATGALTEHVGAQDPRLVDAARSLGASEVRAWTHVVLPLAAPAAWAAGLATFISIIKELPATLILAPLEFETLATHIWAQTEDAFFTSAAPPVLVLVGVAGFAGWLATRIAPRLSRRS